MKGIVKPILTNKLQSFNELMVPMPLNPATNRQYTRAPVILALHSMYKDGDAYVEKGRCPITGQKCNVWALSNAEFKNDVVEESTLYQTVMSRPWDGNIFAGV
jgi:hypothetical protein